jgi:WhiB family redox-sensing transcriptional regulator
MKESLSARPDQLLLSERRRNIGSSAVREAFSGDMRVQKRRSHWQEEAVCVREDPELFFPIGTTGQARIQAEQAKAVCKTCPVIEECLKYALDTSSDVGIWGGMSEAERTALRRRRARQSNR